MIKIVKAKLKNSNFFLSLRNDKKARANSKRRELIKVSDHENWFKKALKNKNYKFFVIKYSRVNCGYLRLEKMNRNYFVSIFVLSKFRKKKIASKALLYAENYLRNEKNIFAYVKNNNLYSKKLFIKLGYVFLKKDGKFSLMKKKLNGLKVIKQIEKIRGKNNFNWMNLLRLAYKNSPAETSKIMAKIYKDDQKISKLVKKLIS